MQRGPGLGGLRPPRLRDHKPVVGAAGSILRRDQREGPREERVYVGLPAQIACSLISPLTLPETCFPCWKNHGNLLRH